MKKIFFGMFIVIIFTLQLFSQVEPSYTINHWDINKDDNSYDVIQLHGIIPNYLIVGSTIDTLYGSIAGLISKVSSNLSPIWSNQYNYSWNKTDNFNAVCQNHDLKSYIAVGKCTQNLYLQQHLIQVDNDGLWINNWFYGPGAIEDICKYQEGFLICGTVGNYHGYNRAFIKYLDGENLGIIWDTIFGSNTQASYTFLAINPTADGGFITTGGNTNNSLVKYDSNFNIQWSQSYGGGSVHQTSSEEMPNDGYVVSAASQSNMYLYKLDNLGNIEWLDTYGGDDARGNSIIQDPHDLGFVLVGSIGGDSAVDGKDIYIVKIDYYGDVLWTITLDGNSNNKNKDIAYSVITSISPFSSIVEYIVTGKIGIFQDPNPESYDVFLMKIINSSDGEYLEKIDLEYSNNEISLPTISRIYSNNNNTQIYLSDINQENLEIKIYNMLGQEIADIGEIHNSQNFVEWNQTNFSGREVSSGTYFVVINTDSYSFSKSFIIIK